MQGRHQRRLLAAEQECVMDRALLQKSFKQEAEEMSKRHQKELFCLIEEVKQSYQATPVVPLQGKAVLSKSKLGCSNWARSIRTMR